MIGSTVNIKGDITCDENFIIDGKVEGNVTCNSHEVTVGQSGNLKANISAKVVKIEGTVEGDISGHEKVIISKTGNVRGNIVAPRVSLEEGARFKGSIDMDPGSQATSELPLTSASKAQRAPDDAAKDSNKAITA